MKKMNSMMVVLMALVLSSCHFDINLGHEDGNGNVVTEERNIHQSFSKVRGSAGLDVYLTEGDEVEVIVEADENLHDIIETYVSNDKLVITTDGSIGRYKARKVYVTYTSLNTVEASSGADVIVNSILKNESITLDVSSGADLEVEVFAKEVYAETSSGSELKVNGKATSLKAKASSGSGLNAKGLLVATCKASASSGADITVNVKDNLESSASSGGDIRYYGNPSAVSKNDSYSGSVRKM